jgi:hypothetical protein
VEWSAVSSERRALLLLVLLLLLLVNVVNGRRAGERFRRTAEGGIMTAADEDSWIEEEILDRFHQQILPL